MRKIRDVLRLTHGLGMSRRLVGEATGIGKTAVGEYVRRAGAAGLTWPIPDEIDDAKLDWAWPTSGKVTAAFSESANLKGIDISGKAGQPVLASAAGRVVYAGAGLRGYGKLVIVKHNNTYLSAYAHNREILVKEGQQVSKGQKIAEMGDTDADHVKLHFEIRRQGKPRQGHVCLARGWNLSAPFRRAVQT